MRPLRGKILAPAALAKRLARERARGQRIVFTNGCFDLLHKGHVTLLESARSLGTTLVVALNGDASVRGLKGPGRPVNRLRDRLEVMAALECVDFVTWFESPTPLLLIRRLRPDILVKGGDWKPHDIVGAPDVLGWGGKVRSLPFVVGRSTTRMLARFRA